ncbi:MAG: MFS transporter [Chloroflexi bacterium]|nr:MFS transporter [Chloroflexota bacterium]
MSEEFGWTRASISGVVTAGTVIGALLVFFVGPIIDRFGARMALVLGAIILGGTLIGMSRMKSETEFYAYYMINRAIGTGLTTPAIGIAVANWFIARRGRAMGLAFMGSRMGSGLLPILAQFQIATWGWRQAWWLLGVLLWATSIVPLAVFIKRRPEDIGLLPDGAARALSGSAVEVKAGVQAPKPEPAWTLRDAVRTRQLWLLAVAASAAQFVMGGINLHMLPHLTDVGIPPTTAVGALTVLAAAAALGGFLWGLSAERFSVRYSLALNLAASALGVALLITVSNAVMAYLFAVFYGVAFGGMATLTSVAWADYFGRISLGAIRGFTHPMALAGNGFGPLAAGWVYDVTGAYTLAFLIYVGLLAAGALLVIMAPRPAASPSALR